MSRHLQLVQRTIKTNPPYINPQILINSRTKRYVKCKRNLPYKWSTETPVENEVEKGLDSQTFNPLRKMNIMDKQSLNDLNKNKL